MGNVWVIYKPLHTYLMQKYLLILLFAIFCGKIQVNFLGGSLARYSVKYQNKN
jgi:hypothetical protein